jgi:transcriptional regulator with XRE-family HTH domain
VYYREFTVNSTTVAQLKKRLKLLGITQDRIAKEAGVTRTMVNKVVNGRATSRRVRYTIERLIEERAA